MVLVVVVVCKGQGGGVQVGLPAPPFLALLPLSLVLSSTPEFTPPRTKLTCSHTHTHTPSPLLPPATAWMTGLSAPTGVLHCPNAACKLQVRHSLQYSSSCHGGANSLVTNHRHTHHMLCFPLVSLRTQLGSWNWHGSSCSCGAHMSPAFLIVGGLTRCRERPPSRQQQAAEEEDDYQLQRLHQQQVQQQQQQQV